MSVNIKQNGDLNKVANNISIVQANWNDKDNTTKNTCIKNQPETLKTLEEISANTNENALAGANAVKELNESLGVIGNAIYEFNSMVDERTTLVKNAWESVAYIPVSNLTNSQYSKLTILSQNSAKCSVA